MSDTNRLYSPTMIFKVPYLRARAQLSTHMYSYFELRSYIHVRREDRRLDDLHINVFFSSISGQWLYDNETSGLYSEISLTIGKTGAFSETLTARSVGQRLNMTF